ncbi:MAG: LTA synthase family protein [Muribaculaceae bacterium]|nr:LTA synthase family protein [Muribaculaceae bacterium]
MKRIAIFFRTNTGAALLNMLVAYAVFMISRLAFFFENYSTFAPDMSADLAMSMLRGALVFDTSALLYINSLYLVLMLLPWGRKEVAGFHRFLKWLFVATNSIGLALNLGDAVYFTYTGRRSTVTVFSEFASENNIVSIFLTEFVNHWYLVLLFAVLVALMWLCYRTPDKCIWQRRWRYYVAQCVTLLVLAPLAIIGIRGSATAGTRPITISNANEYVNRPIEGTVVLNTPFSIIRSIGKKVFVTPSYMPMEEMKRTYEPIITPVRDSLTTSQKKNVVVLIVESMGKEYIGSLNPTLESGHYKGYMPFVDSLLAKSLTFEYTFANGRISMDAMPSILSGIPMMVEPFFLTPASLNDVGGLPKMLRPRGYYSAFFHGAHNISMGFSAFAHAIGYEKYYGLNEYCRSPKYGGMDDFDGKWAIWDEPFLQYTLDEIGTFRQPFLVSMFTASSHHPYNIPAQYAGKFTDAPGGLPIYKCVRYTDMALRRFFERASHEPWFRNTIFVLVADHTNINQHPFYKTEQGLYSIPIIFYTPDGSLRPGVMKDVIAQQTDIMPTLMHILGYDKPYVAFGCDLLSTPADQTWAFNYNNGVYQYFKGDLMLQFDGQKTIGLYRFKTDSLLKQNLAGSLPQQATLEHELKALIQQYMHRMNTNQLILR